MRHIKPNHTDRSTKWVSIVMQVLQVLLGLVEAEENFLIHGKKLNFCTRAKDCDLRFLFQTRKKCNGFTAGMLEPHFKAFTLGKFSNHDDQQYFSITFWQLINHYHYPH